MVHLLSILLIMKLFEVRENKNRMSLVDVGDIVCFFAGKWVIYCRVWCVHRVGGVKKLLQKFNWFTLMPLVENEKQCEHEYNRLVSAKNTKLVVWGVHPIGVKYKGLHNSNTVSPFDDLIRKRAQQALDHKRFTI